MKPNDTIPVITGVNKFIILFNGQKFGEFPVESLKLPCKAYVPIFAIIDNLFNVSMPKKDRKEFSKMSGIDNLIAGLSGHLDESIMDKFIQEDSIMQGFEVVTENEYEEKQISDEDILKEIISSLSSKECDMA